MARAILFIPECTTGAAGQIMRCDVARTASHRAAGQPAIAQGRRGAPATRCDALPASREHNTALPLEIGN
jgi:hypothetical protein